MIDFYNTRRLRLRQLIDERFNGKQKGLADAIDRQPDYISRCLSGRKNIGEDFARQIEMTLGLHVGWMDGAKSMTEEELNEDEILGYVTNPENADAINAMATEFLRQRVLRPAIPIDPEKDYLPIRRVKFKLSAGAHGYAVEYENGSSQPIYFRKDWFAAKGYKPEKLFAVKVCGRSMEPGLYEGDLVVVNSDDTAPRDGEVFAVNYEGELAIKRLRRDEGHWWLSSDSQDKRHYPDKKCTDDVTIIGRVVYKQSEHI